MRTYEEILVKSAKNSYSFTEAVKSLLQHEMQMVIAESELSNIVDDIENEIMITALDFKIDGSSEVTFQIQINDIGEYQFLTARLELDSIYLHWPKMVQWIVDRVKGVEPPKPEFKFASYYSNVAENPRF